MDKLFVILLLFVGTHLFSQNNDAISNPDVMPEFPGGTTEMMKFIQTNLKTPLVLQKDSLIGGCKNLIEFTIDKDGSLINIFVVRSCIGCSACDAEAVKVFEKMPQWKPGTKDNKPVAVKMGMPVFFSFK